MADPYTAVAMYQRYTEKTGTCYCGERPGHAGWLICAQEGQTEETGS